MQTTGAPGRSPPSTSLSGLHGLVHNESIQDE